MVTKMAFKIQKVHVIVATEPDGTEGVPAFFLDGTFYPLISADPARLKSIVEMAEHVASKMQIKMELRRYDNYVVERIIGPDDGGH